MQLALSFWYGPVTYVKTKLFKEGARLVGSIYVLSLLMCLYLSIAGAGYILSLIMIGVQAFALSFFVLGAMRGGETANNLMAGLLWSRATSMLGGGDKGGLPI